MKGDAIMLSFLWYIIIGGILAGIAGLSGTWYFYILQIIMIVILSIWSGKISSILTSAVR